MERSLNVSVALFLFLSACGENGSDNNTRGSDNQIEAFATNGSLERLFGGEANFYVDQNPVPLKGNNSGHREAAPLNRIDVGNATLYVYHRCFEDKSGIPAICASASNDGGGSYDNPRVIIEGMGYAVAPYPFKIGNKWQMLYEEGGPQTNLAESMDGLNWETIKRPLITPAPDEEFVAGASAIEYLGEFYLFYATPLNGDHLHQVIRYRNGPSLNRLSRTPTTVFTPNRTGWNTKSVHMPRIVLETDSEGIDVFYMTFDAGTEDFGCGAGNPPGAGTSGANRFGWGMARSYDLQNWEPYFRNPVRMAARASCGNDMSQPFVRYDGKFFVYHTSDTPNDYKIVREALR